LLAPERIQEIVGNLDRRHNSGRRIIPRTTVQRLYFLENRALVGA
jgi:hypothetical protein